MATKFWATGFWATGFWATDFWSGEGGVVADEDAQVVWRLSVVNINRSISAQDENRGIGFLERNKEVDFQDG